MRISKIMKRAHVGAGLGVLAAALVLGLAAIAFAQNEFSALPAGASVKIVKPADGASVKNPILFAFEVTGTQVKPAGAVEKGTGHHHLIVDAGPMAEGAAIPADATHIHYGKGQTEANVELKPGEHTVTLQFADGLHRSYGPAGANTIKVRVLDGY
jgi:hypothetical protein